MARTAKDYDTRTKTARAKLASRRQPYYRQVASGKTLGYIRRDGAAGSWVVRELVAGVYRWRALGEADDIARADGRDILTFEQALRAVTDPTPTAPIGKLLVRTAI